MRQNVNPRSGRAGPPRPRIVLSLCLLAGAIQCAPAQSTNGPVTAAAAPRGSVFDAPAASSKAAALMQRTLALAAKKQLEQAEQVLVEALRDPDLDAAQIGYNIACVRALAGRSEAALDGLAAAVAAGFADAAHMRKDPDLASLRARARFQELVRLAGEQATQRARPVAVPAPVEAGDAGIGESNTAWDPVAHRFLVLHRFPEEEQGVRVTTMSEPAGDLLRQWQDEGTAAGLHGFLYDNRDKGHSPLNMGLFPQLAYVSYSKRAAERDFNQGTQFMFLHNAPTIGNCSMAVTEGAFWRSMARHAYQGERTATLLADQYLADQLYCYPEHNDHDPEYGDVFPANTPYLVTSQGSSGSDQPFVKAAAATMAAFTPETQRFLRRHHLLCATFQMILRRCCVAAPEDYLTGKAHPAVFAPETLQVEKMVRMAHALKTNEVPPLVRLRVVEEDEGRPGVDYCEVEGGEKLFDTVSAVARVARSARWQWRMVIDAAATRDPNGRALKFTWRLLRGDPDRVQVRPLTADGTRAELRVAWHERGVYPGCDIPCSRVDIGVFAHNGAHDSAPAFVTWYFPANEKRTYDADHRLVSIERLPATSPATYVDPAVVTPADWMDTYEYNDGGRLLGWTRRRGGETERFTRDGALVVRQDALGRPREARVVMYQRDQASREAWPVLRQVPAPAVIDYSYTGDADRLGSGKRRMISLEKE